MLSLPASVRIYVALQPVDGRKGIDGLAALVRSVLGFDPLSGALFVFFSRRCDRARILYFSANGYWLLSRRLERGRFHLPWTALPGGASPGGAPPSGTPSGGAPPCGGASPGGAARPIDGAQLQLILEGIDLREARHRPRWSPEMPAPAFAARG